MGGWRRGPFQSGANYHQSRDILELHVRDNADYNWLQARAESIYCDRAMTAYYGWRVDAYVPETEDEMRAQWYNFLDSGIPAQAGCALRAPRFEAVLISITLLLCYRCADS